MSLFILLFNTQRYVFYFFTVISLVLIGIIVFSQQNLSISQYSLVSHSISQSTYLQGNRYFPRLHQPLSSSILRGILIFYPANQEAHFLSELLWLFRSWIEVMKYEPSSWRTDLVIYSDKYVSNLEQLGCLYNQIRKNREEPPRCRVFPYRRIHSRSEQNTNHSEEHLFQQFDSLRSTLLVRHLRNYEYLDSINIIAECYPSFAMYDYILRTDMDVFLTVNFAHFVPVNDALLIGRGGYSNTFNTIRLGRIARDMHWSYANLSNLGSTWYAPPKVAQRVANLSLEAMIHLSIYEFTTPEKEGKLGIMLWPEWHHGVLLLYSCHLAINHLVSSESLNLGLAYEYLDQSSTNTDRYDLEKNNRLHLHCWHTMSDFSKFRFKAGHYKHLDPNKYLHDTSAAGFCMRMALESQRMSFPGLKQALLQAKNSSKS